VSGEGGAPMECVHIYIGTRYSILFCSTWTRFDLNNSPRLFQELFNNG
jgi:hypothetical protein